jgi:hypothetical protein
MNSHTAKEDIPFVRRTWNIINYLCGKGGALLSVSSSSYKRMSSKLKASMTVEACLVLPLFLFAFLNIMSIIDMYRIQGSMSAAIHDAEKFMAVNAYEYSVLTDEYTEGEHGTFGSVAISYTIASGMVQHSLGDIYPSGTSWGLSKVLEENDCIDLVAEYSVKSPIGVMGFGEHKMFNRLRTRAWTGYDNAQNGTGDGDEEIVYVAETGTVYHRSRVCTYLKLSITPISATSVNDERNMGGSRYCACEECGSRSAGTLYITNHGTKYHSTLSCSKLKRTVSAIPISQVGGKGACSKCGH